MTTHDLAWMAAEIGKTPDWIRRHLDDIPHRRIGASLRFTDQDRDDYLEAVAIRPRRMETTGPKRRRA